MSEFEVPQPPAGLRLGLDLSAALLHRLGRRRYLISDAAANAVFALQPRRRRAAISNYGKVFPELDRRRARRLARRSFREYGRTSLDFLYVHRLPRARLIGMFHGAGIQHFQRLQAEGRTGVLVLMHLGGWDAGGAYANAVGVPITAVMTDEGGGAFQELVVWSRAQGGIRVVVASRSARFLLETMRQGRWVALLADIPGDTPSVEVEFLGHRTRFSVGPAMLASHTGCPLVPVVAVRDRRGDYLVEVHPPHYLARGQDPAEGMRPLLEVFEAAVRRWPDQWFPFDEGRLFDAPPR